MKITFDLLENADAKVREAILYVSKKCEKDETFGATMLNKVLFFADIDLFLRTGKSVTERQHQKLPQGPALRCLVPIRDRMEAAGTLKREKHRFMGKTQDRPIALREPDTSVFTAEELAALDAAIAALRDKTATQVSAMSHKRFNWWDLLKLKETVDLRMALLRKPNRVPQEVIVSALKGTRHRGQVLIE